MSDAPTPRRLPRPPRWLLVLGALALVAGGGVFWWLDGGRDLFSPKNWGVVEEGLVYRSGRIHRRLIRDVLQEHHVAVVIDLAGTDAGAPDFEPEREAARDLGIGHHTFSHLDGHGMGDFEDYVAAFALLLEARRAKRPVLVHCGGGSERTGAICAWYRMLVQGWDGARAWREYLSYRARPPESPALQERVNREMPLLVERMRARGLLDAVPDPLPVFGPAAAARR